MNFKSVTKAIPCEICGKLDWCTFDHEKKISICRRVMGGIHREDRSGADYWIYGLKDKPDRGFYPKRTICKKLNSTNQNVAPPEILDSVYSELIGQLKLSKVHFDNLNLKRKLPKTEIERNGYVTLKNSYRKSTAIYLAGKFGDETCSQIPGMFRDERGDWSLCGWEGLIIPVRNINSQIIALKIRTDGQGKYLWLSSKSKNGLSPGCPIHFPINNYVDVGPLRITEGELKADIASLLTGIPTISMPGVGTWKKVIPILQKLNPTIVKLAYDSDFDEKKAVASSLIKLSEYLKHSGFKYEVELWKSIKA